MKKRMYLFLGVAYAAILGGCNQEKERVGEYRIENGKMVFQTFEESVTFSHDFIVFFSEEDPQMAMRPSGIEDIKYNVPTWQGAINKVNLLSLTERLAAESGDGFDDSILDGEVSDRTADLFAAGGFFYPELESINHFDGGFELFFIETDFGKLKALFRLDDEMPTIDIEFVPNKNGYFSIGYVGAESFDLPEVEEIWQPLIWQEKRFPTRSFLSLAFRAPVPTSLVQHRDITYGVVAHPDEFPYSPLPKMENSRFGVALRNKDGMAQPMLFAPVLGGAESKMVKGESYGFKMIAYAIKSDLVNAYADIAQNLYGFNDYRRNDIASLNTAIENIVHYSLTDFAWFVDSLKWRPIFKINYSESSPHGKMDTGNMMLEMHVL